MPEAGLPPHRRRLNWLQLLGTSLLQGFKERLQRIDLDGQPRRLERCALLRWTRMISTDKCDDETAASSSPVSG